MILASESTPMRRITMNLLPKARHECRGGILDPARRGSHPSLRRAGRGRSGVAPASAAHLVGDVAGGELHEVRGVRHAGDVLRGQRIARGALVDLLFPELG